MSSKRQKVTITQVPANFDNEERRRYYGKRVGDIVENWSSFGVKGRHGEVVGYGLLDNNRIEVMWDGLEEPQDEVAEWMTIITKVEDRPDFVPLNQRQP